MREGRDALVWHHAYTRLAHAHPSGIAGAICARAEAHVTRLALLYALTDSAPAINTEHLQAALALWDYAGRPAELWTATPAS